MVKFCTATVHFIWKFASNLFMLTENRKHRRYFLLFTGLFSQSIKIHKLICRNLSQHCAALSPVPFQSSMYQLHMNVLLLCEWWVCAWDQAGQLTGAELLPWRHGAAAEGAGPGHLQPGGWVGCSCCMANYMVSFQLEGQSLLTQLKR